MARYSKAEIAAAKALMREGVGPKLLARISHIPFHTLRNWDAEKSQGAVQPHADMLERLRALWATAAKDTKPA